MKKTTNLAKRILSVMLSLMIISSFALVSVSAIPADYTVVDNKVEKHTFETGDSWKISAVAGSCSVGASEEKAYNGDKSLKVTVAEGKTLFKIWFTPSVATFEANSTYYMSFMFYSDVWAGDTAIWDSTGTKDIKFYAADDGWKKAVVKFTTGATFESYFAIGGYNTVNGGDVIYIDNFEVAKVDGFTAKTNAVPEGATVVRGGTKDFDTDASTGIGVAMGVASGSATKVGVTAAAAHWGDRSYAIKGNAGNTGNVEFYFHPRLLIPAMNMGSEDNLTAGSYYMSYYVYSPDATITTSAVSTIGSAVAPTTIPQGEWTKVSGMFTVSEANNNKLNSGLFNVAVNGIGENTVYFDDFVFAEITDLQNVSLTTKNVEYNSADNTAKVTVESNIELKTAEVAEAEGYTATSATVDGKIITVELSDLSTDSDYSVLISVRDAFDRLIDRYVTFKTPMTISASSVANGATDVLAPVDYILIETPVAVVEETVTADKFTIEGYGASITAVSVVDGKIKVDLDGIYPAEDYTLSVSGVESAEGAELMDSIAFTTRNADYGYFLNFDNLHPDEETGEVKVPGQLSPAGSTLPIILNEEEAYSGTHSIKLNGIDVAAGYAMMWINGTFAKKTYQVSFYIQSDKWKVSNAGYTLFDSERGTMVGTPIVEDTDKEGWRKVTASYISNAGGIYLTLWGIAGTTVYLDDIRVKEVGTISNPVMLNNGSVVNTITAGTTEIEIPVLMDTANLKAYAVQYDANGKMLRVVEGTTVEGAINITLADAEEVETKIIFMDTSASYAPVIDYLQFN